VDATLFDDVGSGRPAATPLAVRMRPRTIGDLVGQGEALAEGGPLHRLLSAEDVAGGRTSVILWGPPGSGKTTIANLLASRPGRRYVELSAISAGVKEVRAAIALARDNLAAGLQTVLFIDEVHRFSRTQQDALLPAVENGWVTLVAATTENPAFSVVGPLLSRAVVVRLVALTDSDVGQLLRRALIAERGLGGEFELTPEAEAAILQVSGGDARRALTALDAAAGVARARWGADAAAGVARARWGADGAPGVGAARDGEGGTRGAAAPGVDAGAVVGVKDSHGVGDVGRESADGRGESEAAGGGTAMAISAEDVAAAVQERVVDLSRDTHYDLASAFIKSVRGSDVDAALHYLARLLVAGEDPRFVARRLVILASEDVGMADPNALVVATAAMTAAAGIGMPEARLPLAQATVHLALAPKSNAVYRGINQAMADVASGVTPPVPAHLRDASYRGASQFGHGAGYVYPHDDPAGVVEQQYAPEDLTTHRYYVPARRGAEGPLVDRVEALRVVVRGRQSG
jgi:putative ATPase